MYIEFIHMMEMNLLANIKYLAPGVCVCVCVCVLVGSYIYAGDVESYNHLSFHYF